ncbi:MULTISPECIES: substrate-binding domain-containing protein [Streptomyces]|uniref:substrate-binding domain-containing protein n=1 Tax=Streptomyces sp. LRE541 TaxID=2931983 RepID=UPI00200F391E|nr:substrate-binding domain-containing protein [Streptomyces sp. LRE541]UPZ33705.1 substrate-binding domain-containing protein [Streptomyces sp. LRE541]
MLAAAAVVAHIEHLETDRTRIAEMPNTLRSEGYRRAMRERGLADETDVVSTSYTQEGGYLGAQQLLTRKRRPTAIFAGSDFVAMGVLEALAEGTRDRRQCGPPAAGPDHRPGSADRPGQALPHAHRPQLHCRSTAAVTG